MVTEYPLRKVNPSKPVSRLRIEGEGAGSDVAEKPTVKQRGS